MFTNGTRIQIDEGGSYDLVENLSIGQFILNPFSGKKNEIIDLLTRSVELDSENTSWTPIVIPEHSIRSNVPEPYLMVSPRQMIMKKKGSLVGRIHETEVVRAMDVAGSYRSNANQVTYTAIFLAETLPIVANGVLCMSFSNEVYR